MLAFRDLVLIGRVVKPQGRHGEVLVEPLSDRPDRFPTLRRAFAPGPAGGIRELHVTACRSHKRRFALKLEGIDSIEGAEGLRGAELRIAEEELAPLPPGSFYHHQLEGLRVEDEHGAELGQVEGVMDTGAGAKVLVVRGASGETLVPFAETFVEKIDVPRGRIVVRRPEYVLAH